MRVFDQANYPFHRWRKRAYIVFGVLIVAGIAGMIRNVIVDGSWLSYGVEFTGGTLVQIEFTQTVPAEELRAAAEAAGQQDWEITRFGDDSQFVIRMQAFEQGAGEDATSRVTEVMSTRFQPDDFRIVRTDAVGPKVGDELQQRALLAIVLAFIAALIYLALRFEWRFGLASILATIVDILVVLGYLALSGAEVSLGTVAALLTIVGYTLNDKIVVFDRIRENLGRPHSGEDYSALLNRSINETLSRTALTGGGTIATLLALFFLGGPVIRPFAFMLILGIVVGTFSSIFVAAPILYEIELRSKTFGVKRGKTTGSKEKTRRASV